MSSDFFAFEPLSDFLSEDSDLSLESDSSESFDPSFALSEDFEPLTPVLPEAVVEPETDTSLATMLSPVTARAIQSMDHAPLVEGWTKPNETTMSAIQAAVRTPTSALRRGPDAAEAAPFCFASSS